MQPTTFFLALWHLDRWPPVDGQAVRLATIPNVIPSERVRGTDFAGFFEVVHIKMVAPVERLLDWLSLEQKPDAIVADTFLAWGIGVGSARGIPVCSLWTQPATFFLALWHLDRWPTVDGQDDKLANNITTQQGKTLKDAWGDVFWSLEVEHACGMGTLQMGEYESNVSNGNDTFSIREPLGVSPEGPCWSPTNHLKNITSPLNLSKFAKGRQPLLHNYSGDADSKIVREVWARLLDQALTKGGVAEACSVVKRVGSKLDPADGACLPLDIICLHLEKAAVDRLSSGEELVGDDGVARALLGACKGLPGPVLVVYDHLLSNGAIIPSLNLKLRLLRSVLAILREWGISVIAHRLGTTSAGASFFLDGTFSLNQTGTANQGARDKIISLANRYMTEVRRLNLP
ncbi:Nuclear pore complex protein NUP155 [Zea mays]|uniref:Nuclear pore complex protein NUP155 n=1 Tax=Zea mays TaxID=4577 RepID=A0A3L6FSJ5_MAIZE|nr:Nuclear pore complex protein NUP155 [Zea mays]